jgi:DNA (cytosine-5)-methyltransferase 1
VLPKIVSLFSGAGGLDLGFLDAGFEIVFALDNSKWANETHRKNFPTTVSIVADIIELMPTGVTTKLECLLNPGEAIGIIGGPPCQGFSRANTSSSPNDPRNQLPFLYLDVIESLQRHYEVKFILFENVPGIKDKKHKDLFQNLIDKLNSMGFKESVSEFCALDFGVPQDRVRVIVSGFRTERIAENFLPEKIEGGNLDLKAAIGGLPDPLYYGSETKAEDNPVHPNHWTMRPISKRFSDTSLIKNGTRSFRRLDWDKPSPTVAYGHREIHVHPNGHRRLSIFEAMTLQGFPSTFVFEGTLSSQVEQVSNAVPPPLAKALGKAVVSVLDCGVEGSDHI